LESHTWSHCSLAALEDGELEVELTRPLRWLKQTFPHAAIPCISYPYGLNSPLVRRKAAEAGYTAGLLVEGGVLTRSGLDPYALPRLNVPAGVSVNGFTLRTSGLLSR